MANKYVYSGAGGAGTGADWANAYTTISAAAAAVAAGDDIWVASDHAESTAAAITPTFPGTLAAPNRIFSVNRAGSVPPVSADLLAGASVTTTGASSLSLNGNFSCWGLTFNCGTGATSATLACGAATANRQRFENCNFNLLATSTSNRIALSNQTSSFTSWKNCKVKLAATGQGLTINGLADWQNDDSHPAIDAASSLPTSFIIASTSMAQSDLRGLDLSALGSGKALVGASVIGLMRFIGCKIDAAVTVATTPTATYAMGTELIGCSGTTQPSRNEKHHQRGSLTSETTIVRTGGALGPDATPVSWKIVSNANTKREFPFTAFETAIPNQAAGAPLTVAFHTVTDGVTLTDADAWLEVDYPGSNATPLLYPASDAPATVLTAGTNQTASTETWTTTGLASPVKQKLSVTFTPQMAGLIRCRLKVAKASTTVYICPLAVVA